MTNAIAEERLRLQQLLANVDAQRGQLLFALQVLDRLEHGSTQPGAPAAKPRSTEGRRRSVGGQPSTTDLVVAVINAGPERAWRPEDLIAPVRQRGWTSEVQNEVETIRAALSRAVRAGQIRRVGLGAYASTEADGGPANASAEDHVNTEVDEGQSGNEPDLLPS